MTLPWIVPWHPSVENKASPYTSRTTSKVEKPCSLILLVISVETHGYIWENTLIFSIGRFVFLSVVSIWLWSLFFQCVITYLATWTLCFTMCYYVVLYYVRIYGYKFCIEDITLTLAVFTNHSISNLVPPNRSTNDSDIFFRLLSRNLTRAWGFSSYTDSNI